MSETALSVAGPLRRVDDVATLLSGTELFAGLDEIALAGIASGFKRVELSPGEVLWRQATPHSGLYVLLDGEVQVCRQLPGERELELARLGRGEVMGEIPLLGGGMHFASVRALTGCTLLLLRRAQFEAYTITGDAATLELRRRIVAIACARLRDTYAALTAPRASAPRSEPLCDALPAVLPPLSYLSRLPLFRDLEPDVVAELLERGKAISVPRGQVVQRQGDVPDVCHVVLNGAVEDVLCGNTASRRVGFAGPGHTFGAVALLDGGQAPVSSVTRERSLLLAIARDDVWALSGALESDLIRSLEVAARALSHLTTATAWLA